MTDKSLRRHLVAILPDATQAQIDGLMELCVLVRVDELEGAIHYERNYNRKERGHESKPYKRNIRRVEKLLQPFETRALADRMRDSGGSPVSPHA